MAELLAPERLIDWVPGRILSKSDDLGWSGVASRTYAYKGQDVAIPAMRDFLLVSYKTGVTPMERRFDGRWSQATCGPGVVSLLTRSQASHWNWSQDVAVDHVYLTQEFVSSVAAEVAGRSVSEVSLADVLRTDDPLLATMVDLIAGEAKSPGLGGAMYAEAAARQLVVHLLRNYASVSVRPAAEAGCFSEGQSRTILEFIDAHLDGTIDLATLAATVNMGACTFSRYFRRTFGIAPYSFVMERRLECARRLLAETGVPTKTVASMCGFSDQSHLARLFARRYGMPPARFRKSSRM